MSKATSSDDEDKSSPLVEFDMTVLSRYQNMVDAGFFIDDMTPSSTTVDSILSVQ